MGNAVGRNDRVLHSVVLLAFAVPGIGILLLVARIVATDPQSIALLVVIFAAPIWVAGLFAAFELLRLVRGGSASFGRVLSWAVGAIVGGAMLGYFTGFFTHGLDSLSRLDPAAWLVLVWITAGAASLISLIASRRRSARAPTGQL